MKILLKRIKDLRLSFGYSRFDLAKILWVTPATIYRWETGKSIPRISKIILISKHFKVSIDFLLGLSVDS